MQRQVNFTEVTLNSGFWQQKQRMVADISIQAVYDRFAETGRFEAMKCQWREGMPQKPHIFWDSDVAKWIESVAYVLEKEEHPHLEELADRAIQDIVSNQGEDGYFNVWFTVAEPDSRFQKRTEHELYCAGHLIEAAVAYFHATGKDQLLKAMCRYADYIEQVFVKEQSAAFSTPGHEEIELALVKLYRCTGERRYLELSKFFIDRRGTEKQDFYGWANAYYAQDHLPVRQQTTAEGHSVRAVYLYCAMADLAMEYGDEELFSACRSIFHDIAEKKMYVTGGIGSSRVGEAFTIPYDLPNLTAYTESCAALGLALFASRMSCLEADSLYADVAERAIYNGFLSSISLDGKSFFYENPLEIYPPLREKDTCANPGHQTVLPISQRVEVFACSCCPPNITRFIASIGNLLYTHTDTAVYVHQYMDSKAEFLLKGDPVILTQRTQYPENGTIAVRYEGEKPITLALRIPSWCRQYTATVDGKLAEQALVERGYLLLHIQPGSEVLLELTMETIFLEANPQVREDSGRCAVQRGPLVYCAEEIDNGPQLRELVLNWREPVSVERDEALHVPRLVCKGKRRAPFSQLYRPLQQEYIPCEIRFIPYYAFANRGETEMLVWFQYD